MKITEAKKRERKNRKIEERERMRRENGQWLHSECSYWLLNCLKKERGLFGANN